MTANDPYYSTSRQSSSSVSDDDLPFLTPKSSMSLDQVTVGAHPHHLDSTVSCSQTKLAQQPEGRKCQGKSGIISKHSLLPQFSPQFTRNSSTNSLISSTAPAPQNPFKARLQIITNGRVLTMASSNKPQQQSSHVQNESGICANDQQQKYSLVSSHLESLASQNSSLSVSHKIRHQINPLNRLDRNAPRALNHNHISPLSSSIPRSLPRIGSTASVSATSDTGGGRTNGSPKLSQPALKKNDEADHVESLVKHRGELSINEKYRYDLSKAQLKASSRTSALLSGFAMIALVELQYTDTTPKPLLIILGVVTTLLVSVHLLALMMSTCLLPYIEANGCTQDSPHIKLKFYIELSWLFSTCIGLLLFLVEIGVILFVKFNAIGYTFAAYVTTGMLVPVVIIFTVISYLIHRSRLTHTIERVNDKVVDLHKFLDDAEDGHQPQLATDAAKRETANVELQRVSHLRNINEV